MNLANMVDRALSQVGNVRTLTLRTVTSTGGDSFLGRPGTQTPNDTPVTGPYRGYYAGAKAEELSVGGRNVKAEDYILILSANQFTLQQAEDQTLIYIFTDSLGRKEAYSAYDYDPADYQGQYVAFTLYLRSIGHAPS